jgi:hypothetical protein
MLPVPAQDFGSQVAALTVVAVAEQIQVIQQMIQNIDVHATLPTFGQGKSLFVGRIEPPGTRSE